MGTPFWPITVYMLSLAFMSGILYVTLWGTSDIVGTTTRILAWRRARREEHQVIHDNFRGEWQILVLGKENFEKMKRQLESVWREGGDGEQ